MQRLKPLKQKQNTQLEIGMGKQTVIKTKGQGRHFKRNAILISLLAAINTSYAAEQVNEDVEVIEVRGIRSSTAENLAIK